jgi:hypothetical protein
LQWKKRFEKFERYADRLGAEAAELKTRIEAEKKEAKRLSGVVSQTKERNTALYDGKWRENKPDHRKSWGLSLISHARLQNSRRLNMPRRRP